MAVQADKKIIVSGVANNTSNMDFATVRYRIGGSLDTTFGNAGKVLSDFGGNEIGYATLIQPDGKNTSCR